MPIEIRTLLSPAGGGKSTPTTDQRKNSTLRRKHSHSSDTPEKYASSEEDGSGAGPDESSSHSGSGRSAADDDDNRYWRQSDNDNNNNNNNNNNNTKDDSYEQHYDYAPPFLPLEEQNQSKPHGASPNPLLAPFLKYLPRGFRISAKHIVSFIMCSVIAIVVWDALFAAPEDRWLRPESSIQLLTWVQSHPLQGLVWITLTIAACVVVMIPLGTPLTLGCGYVYKGAYGWRLGVFVATLVSMGGSCLGAVICFLLGRYLMRDTVKRWNRKYPLFDAIDIAAAEHGLRIMAMLYLTPILPLGPVSYMCGTTAMPLSSFVLAKVAALPLMLLYVFIGASMGALVGGDPNAAAKEVQQIEQNEYLIAAGIGLSFVTIACITRQVKRELNKILERQQKLKPGETEPLAPSTNKDEADDSAALELGITKRRRA